MRRRLLVALLLVLAVPAAGCGYRDDNADAARIVADAYLRAQEQGDSVAICRILGPGQQAFFAGRGNGSCEAGIQAGFGDEPAYRTGTVSEINTTTMAVTIDGLPQQPLTLMRMGSTWRIVGGWKVY